MAILNLGILAHVDAGKTTLTERILYETGVIRSIGSVDKGTTQTDTLELERARGITIKSAVVSFQLGELKVNLIDTPGHGDFIAEVERSLRVLDGVVLVVSAVEGVQSQTRRLAGAIQAIGLPLIVFVNKIDRIGARGDMLLDDIRQKLKLRVTAMNAGAGLGARGASVTLLDRDSPAWREPLTDLLAETSERVIEEFERRDGNLSRAFLEAEIRAQVAAATLAPVYFGSAITGAGVAELLDGVAEWLPPARVEGDLPPVAPVFKITRLLSGEKVVYVRLFTGSLSVRQRVLVQHRNAFGEIERIEERITGVDRFASGSVTPADTVGPGDIARLHGLRSAMIGDLIGTESTRPLDDRPAFPPPALESVVRPVDPNRITQLRTALAELAEQDPLISLRQRNDEGEISLRLYGEVQKEVMTETLLGEYGLDVTFGPSQVVCVEYPTGAGEHVEYIGQTENPFVATVGLRIEPALRGSGIHYVHGLGALPLAFYRAIEESVHEALTQGLCGWEVSDCLVTLTQVGYSSVASTAGDFRKLTPLVLMRALSMAGTEVCEPFELLELEIPEDAFGAVCGALVLVRATIQDSFTDGAACRVICEIPTAELRAVEQQLPGLTHGEGGWTSRFLRYMPVAGEPPARRRIGPDPLNRAQYLAELARS
jgi:ribosomal protection tetracycline resistance protein